MDVVLKLLELASLLLGLSNSDGSNSSLVSYDEWWGPEGTTPQNDTSIRPLTIEFKKDMITDLKYRLNNHRAFTPPLKNSTFEYGFNTEVLDSWLTYWSDTYNFTEREAFLNQFPQYKTNIQGLDIHFIRVTPKKDSGKELVPILLLHGWPGSVREFYETIPMLTAIAEDRDYALDVIVPSLPGFGFSDAATRPGLGGLEIAVVLRNLMHRLGFKQFYVQGGDWGSYIGTCMSTVFPNEVLGYHTNMPVSLSPSSAVLMLIGAFYPDLVVEPELADRMYPIQSVLYWLTRETGYMHLQATKPDSLGVAMSDSPSGILAYIFQQFASGSRRSFYNRKDGGLTDLYSREKLLDNLMIYWVTNSFTTSSRLYAETLTIKSFNTGVVQKPTTVPTWTIHAKDEIVYQPPSILKLKFLNLLNSTVLDTGGHFLALELPRVLADDVLNSIKAFRKWHLYKD